MEENREYLPEGIRELFVPYTIAWNLQHPSSKSEEERGAKLFDKECIAFWNHYQEAHMNHTYDEYADLLKAPMFEQVVGWLRDKHNIYFEVRTLYTVTSCIYSFSLMYMEGHTYIETPIEGGKYYDALTRAIEAAIKIIKNK